MQIVLAGRVCLGEERREVRFSNRCFAARPRRTSCSDGERRGGSAPSGGSFTEVCGEQEARSPPLLPRGEENKRKTRRGIMRSRRLSMILFRRLPSNPVCMFVWGSKDSKDKQLKEKVLKSNRTVSRDGLRKEPFYEWTLPHPSGLLHSAS